MIRFEYHSPRGVLAIPQFLSEANLLPAKEQLDTAYAHGGGWRPMTGWKHLGNGVIKYPGDPALRPVAIGRLREEIIYVYPHDWVGIFQPDGSFEIARMD